MALELLGDGLSELGTASPSASIEVTLRAAGGHILATHIACRRIFALPPCNALRPRAIRPARAANAPSATSRATAVVCLPGCCRLKCFQRLPTFPIDSDVAV